MLTKTVKIPSTVTIPGLEQFLSWQSDPIFIGAISMYHHFTRFLPTAKYNRPAYSVPVLIIEFLQSQVDTRSKNRAPMKLATVDSWIYYLRVAFELNEIPTHFFNSILISRWRASYRDKLLLVGAGPMLTTPILPDDARHILDLLLERVESAQTTFAKFFASRLFSIITILFFKGRRMSDVLKAKVSDMVKVPAGHITITPALNKTCRSAELSRVIHIRSIKDRHCPLKALRVYSRARLLYFKDSRYATRDQGYIWPNRMGKIWSSQALISNFTPILRSLPGHLTIHGLRVGLAMTLSAIGIEDEEIMSYMKWSSSSSLDRYRAGSDLASIRRKEHLETHLITIEADPCFSSHLREIYNL